MDAVITRGLYGLGEVVTRGLFAPSAGVSVPSEVLVSSASPDVSTFPSDEIRATVSVEDVPAPTVAVGEFP